MSHCTPQMHTLKNVCVCVHVCVLSACKSVHHVWAWCPCRLEDGIGSPGTGITDVNHPVGAGI